MKGAGKTLEYAKDRGYITAIISASSIDAAKRVQKDYGIDYIYANAIGIKDGKISGEFKWPIGAGKENKANIIIRLCDKLKISPEQVIYVGDSESDIEACKKVGMSIAFNSKSDKLKKYATHIVESDDLSDIIRYV
jgi:phosphoserine phosphatase